MGNLEQRINLAVLLCLLSVALTSCNSCGDDSYSPKPRGFYRLQFPAKAYQEYSGPCPYTFKYPTYSRILRDSSRDAQPCWINIDFPQLNGKIHLSYHPVTSQKVFNELVEDSRTFAFKHTVKATSIDEARIMYPQKKVYGVYYTIEGNTASSVQFFLTDSTRHYLRGALYFNEAPRIDSIKPVLDFVKKDIDVMIKSFTWK
ncbi:gliding motility lipoprotein GldD [Arcticibacter tournemirensis]